MTKPIISFIDDSSFEHQLVERQIASQAPELDFRCTFTFEECRENLAGRAPALFLLDLWGKDEAVRRPCIASLEELQAAAAGIPALESVYAGLDHFPGDVHNEYLKRLFTIVDGWRGLFQGACDRVGQNRRYGLKNLTLARNLYPGVPAVFYTRKSLIQDAVAMLQAGIDGLFIKPTGADDAETRRLTRAYAPELIRDLKRIMAAKP